MAKSPAAAWPSPRSIILDSRFKGTWLFLHIDQGKCSAATGTPVAHNAYLGWEKQVPEQKRPQLTMMFGDSEAEGIEYLEPFIDAVRDSVTAGIRDYIAMTAPGLRSVDYLCIAMALPDRNIVDLQLKGQSYEIPLLDARETVARLITEVNSLTNGFGDGLQPLPPTKKI